MTGHDHGLALPHWLRGLEGSLEEIKELLNLATMPVWAARLEKKIDALLKLEGIILTDQDHLNSDVAVLSAAFTTIIADLQAQPAAAALDFTAADALVAQVQAAVPAAPVVPTPVVDPTVPVVDPTVPAADTSVAAS